MRPRPKYQIFISSTFADLRDAREAVVWEVLKASHIPAGMENFPATNDRGWRIIQRTIDASDYYVILLAGRYGTFDSEIGMSWTEREYDYAKGQGMPVLAFIRDDGSITADKMEKDPEQQQRLANFRAKLEANHHREKWNTHEDLATKVVQALGHQVNDEQAEPRLGWYRGDQVGSALATEFARLSSENASLKARLNSLESTDGKKLEGLMAGWLASIANTRSRDTIGIWEGYAKTHWLPHFVNTAGLTRERCQQYIDDRLGKVLATSVQKELYPLGAFFRWLAGDGGLVHLGTPEQAAAMIPRVPADATGTAYKHRRRSAAIDLSPEQVRAVLRALPEWNGRSSGERYPVRARFIIQYETTLESGTLDRLVAPTHYKKGDPVLRITEDTNRERWARELPLTRRIRRILDHVLSAYERETGAPLEGPIFGEHDYRRHTRAAARKALPPELAEVFTPAHLRSAAIAHRLARDGVSLSNTQYMVGHKLLTTTVRYIKST